MRHTIAFWLHIWDKSCGCTHVWLPFLVLELLLSLTHVVHLCKGCQVCIVTIYFLLHLLEFIVFHGLIQCWCFLIKLRSTRLLCLLNEPNFFEWHWHNHLRNTWTDCSLLSFCHFFILLLTGFWLDINIWMLWNF